VQDVACASAFRRFGKHLQRMEVFPGNPLELLESTGEPSDPGDRAGTTEEVRALLVNSIQRCTGNRKARGNAPLYWLWLALTGLRAWEEAPKVLWGNIYDLDGPTPHIWTDKRWSKNGRRMRIPIASALRDLLVMHRRSVPNGAGDRVFPQVPNRATFNVDRGNAMIRPKTGEGVFGAHSLRKWLSTELNRTGCNAGVRYKILRHAGNITEDRYTATDLAEELAAVNNLPRLWPEKMPVPEGFSAGPRKSGENSLDSAGGFADADGVKAERAVPMLNHPHDDPRPSRTGNSAAALTIAHGSYMGGAAERRGDGDDHSARSAETAGVQYTRGLQAGNGQGSASINECIESHADAVTARACICKSQPKDCNGEPAFERQLLQSQLHNEAGTSDWPSTTTPARESTPTDGSSVTTSAIGAVAAEGPISESSRQRFDKDRRSSTFDLVADLPILGSITWIEPYGLGAAAGDNPAHNDGPVAGSGNRSTATLDSGAAPRVQRPDAPSFTPTPAPTTHRGANAGHPSRSVGRGGFYTDGPLATDGDLLDLLSPAALRVVVNDLLRRAMNPKALIVVAAVAGACAVAAAVHPAPAAYACPNVVEGK